MMSQHINIADVIS